MRAAAAGDGGEMKECVLHFLTWGSQNFPFALVIPGKPQRNSKWKASFKQAQEGSLVAGVQRPWVIISSLLQIGVFLWSTGITRNHSSFFTWWLSVRLLPDTGLSRWKWSFPSFRPQGRPHFCPIIWNNYYFRPGFLPNCPSLGLTIPKCYWCNDLTHSYNSKFKDANSNGLLADLLLFPPSRSHSLLVQQAKMSFGKHK